MVCHPSYKNQDGQWLTPEEAKKLIDAGKLVTSTRMEKMSKSKKNVVDPEIIVKQYGADTARLFMLSDSPPDKDIEWSAAGVKGVHRYVKKLWNLAVDFKDSGRFVSNYDVGNLNPELKNSRTKFHNIFCELTRDIDNLAFNCTIAKIHEITNMLSVLITEGSDSAANNLCSEIIVLLLRVIEPFIPHIAEELWHHLGNSSMLCKKLWPKFEPGVVVSSEITMVIQVNGKKRIEINVPVNYSKNEIEAVALEKAAKWITTPVKKVIIVPNKLINIVI